MTVDGYHQLTHDLYAADRIKTMMMLAHLFDSDSPFSFLIRDLVRFIGKYVDLIIRSRSPAAEKPHVETLN